MRVAGITALGEPVELLDVDEPATPEVDEVLIDVVAAGIGNWDELVRIGSWQIGGPPPMALGTEAAGTVAAVGSAVTELRMGDEVMTHPLPLRRHGTWAGRVLAPAATVAIRPPEASWEVSAAFPIPALTAAQALDEALGIESGSWVVVNGAGGVTGGLLVQLAAARGARVIATASAKKAERIRDYGASEVLDYHDDWPALVREITGAGAPRAVNAARGQAATTPCRSPGRRRRRPLAAIAGLLSHTSSRIRLRVRAADVEGGCRRRPPRHDHGRPAAGGTRRRRIRRLRPARRSAAFGPRGAAGPGHPDRADRVRPPARTGGTSAAGSSRRSRRRDRSLTPNLT